MGKRRRGERGQAAVETLLVNLFVALVGLVVLTVLAAAITAMLAGLIPVQDGYMGSKPVTSGPHVPMTPASR